MKIAHLELGTNQLLGWYTTEIHLEIPEPNISVEDDVWMDVLENHYNYYNSKTQKFEHKDFRNEEQILKQENDNKILIAKKYLQSTDFYMTVDKYATLTEEKKEELITKRAEARELINSLSV